jgi:hypothetical protein
VLVLEKVSPPLALFSRGSCSAIVKCVGRRGVYLLSYFIEDCRDESVVVYKFTSSRLCIL